MTRSGATYPISAFDCHELSAEISPDSLFAHTRGLVCTIYNETTVLLVELVKEHSASFTICSTCGLLSMLIIWD